MPATLLLADDSVTIQRVIEMTFAEEDVRVVTVGDGREAIERIAADPPDIVLADTNMPEKDGYDVSAFVKAESARSRIPVVLLTGAFEPVDDERAREVGCDAVLVKPFEPTAVLNRVRELLGLPADADAAVPAPTGEAAARDAANGAGGDAADEPGAASAAAAGGSGDAAGEPVAAPPAAVDDDSPADPDSASSAAADTPPANLAAASPAEDVSSADPGSASPAEDASPAAPDSASPASADASPVVRDSESPAAHDEEPGDAPAGEAGDAPAPVPAVPAVETPAPPSLADAFAALLAAEQGDLDRARAAYPWPRQAAPPAEDDLVERVAERVVERLSSDITGELVSEVVARVAERLVRDQIGRIEPA